MQSLQEAGFTVNLKQRVGDSTVFNEGLTGDLGTGQWGADWPNASTVIPPLFSDEASWGRPDVDDTSGIPDWTERVNDAQATLDRNAQALKWQNLNREAVEQVWIIPLFFGLSQHIAGTNVGGTYRWAPYGSWPYAQLYAKGSG